ncbi:hypothetical protein ABEF95_000368 [Exophiala dermatitidis]
MAALSTVPETQPTCEIFRQKLSGMWYHSEACGRKFLDHTKLVEWMTATEPNGEVKNVARILRELRHQRKDELFSGPRSRTITTGKNKSILVLSILLEMGCGDLIVTFREANIVDSALAHAPYYEQHLFPKLKTALGSEEEADSFMKEFYQRRWSFIPVCIDYNMSPTLQSGDHVLPFLKKESINTKGGTAEVYQVLIKEDYIGDNMRRAIEKSKFYDKDFGWCYQLAVKTYSHANKDHFQWEKEAYAGLREQPGIVQYLGHYVEEDPNDSKSSLYNILLEFGEADLDEFFADPRSYPPIRPLEIFAFWKSLFEVAEAIKRLHNLVRQDEDGFTDEYHGWHGDIKPDNILLVHGKYKLTDFGFTKFKTRRNEPATVYIGGGTQTYGPPEVGLKGSPDGHDPVTQTIDIWSFGCVLSIAATWIILGYQGILQYENFREQAIADLGKRQPGIDTTAHDAFHDGTEVLPGIVRWHDYLRSVARSSDFLTLQVLDLVEKRMLVGNPALRISSSELCEVLKRMHEEAKKAIRSSSGAGVHESVLKSLLEYDQKAQANAPAVSHARSAGQELQAFPSWSSEQGRSRGDSASLLAPNYAPRKSRRIGKSERLDNIPRAKTAHRTDDLKRVLEADHGVSDVHCTSDYRHDSTDVGGKTTIQSPEPPPLRSLMAEPEQPSASVVQPKISKRGVRFTEGVVMPSQKGGLRPQNPPSTPSKQGAGRNGPTSLPPNGVSPSHWHGYPPPSSPGRSGAPSNPHASPPLRPLPRRVPLPAHDSSLDICKVRRSLDATRPTRLGSILGKRKVDEHLKKFITDRDMIFIVDNGTSMWQFWDVATYVVETLAMKLAGLDDDGLDLVFTIGDEFNIKNARGKSTPTNFGAAMRKAAPRAPGSIVEGDLCTDMAAVLARMFDAYLKSNQRKRMTLLILTDGLWAGSVKAGMVERKIVEFVKNPKLGSLEPRRFSIEFIQFGDDGPAGERLKELDNTMEHRFGIEDIIDTEPWTGRVNKMITGSILEHEDMDEVDGQDPSLESVSGTTSETPTGNGVRPGPGPVSLHSYPGDDGQISSTCKYSAHPRIPARLMKDDLRV